MKFNNLYLVVIYFALSATEWSLSAAESATGVVDSGYDSRLSMIVPSNPIDCDRKNPWKAGRWNLPTGAYVPSGGCMALKYVLQSSAHMFLIHEAPDGVLTRLAPSACVDAKQALTVKGEYWFPRVTGSRPLIIRLDGESGIERFHMLTFAPEVRSRRLSKQLLAVPGLLEGCQPSSNPVITRAGLEAILEANTVEVDWQSQLINHY